jgi:hypothetical protein
MLPDYLKNAINAGATGLDVMHGHLKTLMLEAEKELEIAQAYEDKTGEAMDSMERKYWEGVLEAYSEVYKLTYDLSFAIADKEQ